MWRNASLRSKLVEETQRGENSIIALRFFCTFSGEHSTARYVWFSSVTYNANYIWRLGIFLYWKFKNLMTYGFRYVYIHSYKKLWFQWSKTLNFKVHCLSPILLYHLSLSILFPYVSCTSYVEEKETKSLPGTIMASCVLYSLSLP